MEPALQRTITGTAPYRRRITMRTRTSVMLVAVTGLLWQTGFAAAGNCGACNYGCTSSSTGDPQTSFSAQQGGTPTAYKLVCDTVKETRWQTTYPTATETVL